jgi:Integrase core domain
MARRPPLPLTRPAPLLEDRSEHEQEVCPSTVGAVLSRHGLGKLPRLQPQERANSYERPRPGELIHIDVKKLGRIARPGHRVNGDRRTHARGIGWEFVHVAVDAATRLAYVEVLDDQNTRHSPPPYAAHRPRTNGKAERFIRTLVDGWAYGGVYRTSNERTTARAGWLDWYNRLRPHCSLGRKPPLTRLAETNNVVGTNT